MKTLAKVLGIVAGALAVMWAMRDRFINVAASREPEVPHFKATSPNGSGASIDAVTGIGPVFATRLKEGGLHSVSDLASASVDTVAEAASVSAARARTWIEQAQQLL